MEPEGGKKKKKTKVDKKKRKSFGRTQSQNCACTTQYWMHTIYNVNGYYDGSHTNTHTQCGVSQFKSTFQTSPYKLNASGSTSEPSADQYIEKPLSTSTPFKENRERQKKWQNNDKTCEVLSLLCPNTFTQNVSGQFKWKWIANCSHTINIHDAHIHVNAYRSTLTILWIVFERGSKKKNK